MPNFNLTPSRAKSIVFIDYKPAELRIKKEWLIVYYAKNPLTEKLDRIRLRVPSLSNKIERTRHANRIVAEINRKLAEGWSPYLESPAKSFKSFKECCEKFVEQTEKEIRDGIKREDTLRTYKSFLNMINTYIKEKGIKITFALEINKAFVVNYLDWVYYDRNNSPRTYNNHLLFFGTFANFLIERGYLKENPTNEITKKRNTKKKREVITPKIKQILKVKLPHYNFHYYVLCMLTYYCMIRRTEITKLKVKNVNLNEDYIFIPAEVSKNKKDEHVTIPAELKKLLERHLDNASANEFLFSKNDFKPGKVQLQPEKISDTWDLIRKHLGIKEGFQFYSLKDTGITDLFGLLGLSPLKIRDQARHYDLKITEMYTPRSSGGDATLKNSGASF